MANDILLDDTGDLDALDGDFVIGDSELQEIALILQTNQGDYKQDPITGANLLRFKNSTLSPNEIRNKSAIALKRDGKDFNRIKHKFRIHAKTR